MAGRLRIVAALTDPASDPDLFGGHRATGGASAEGPELIRVRADRQPEWTPSAVEGRAKRSSESCRSGDREQAHDAPR